MPEERELKHTPHMVRNPYPSSDQPRLCHPTVQNPSPSLPSNHFQKKKKKKNQTPNCEERAESVRSRTQPQIALISSHPSIGEITPIHLPDRAAWSIDEIAQPEAPLRLHPSIGEIAPMTHPYLISLFLNLPLPFPQLSITLFLPLSLHLTEFLSSMNVLFWFLFHLSLYIEIFYYEICLEAEKMWKINRKITFLECNQTLENIF